MLEEHIDVLHKCAALLLEKERINRAEFEALFEPETEVEEETEEPQEETKEEIAPEQDAEQEVWDACAQKEDGDEE